MSDEADRRISVLEKTVQCLRAELAEALGIINDMQVFPIQMVGEPMRPRALDGRADAFIAFALPMTDPDWSWDKITKAPAHVGAAATQGEAEL